MRPAVTATAVSAEILARELETLGRAHGLDAIGIAPADPLWRARAALEDRKAAGLHDGMSFTYRNPARSTTPERALPGASAIVVGARRYRSDPPPPPTAGGPVGRVARYAWNDPYAPLRQSLRAIADHLHSNGHRAVVFADDNAMVDREAAYRAGIGWFGKNANLLLSGTRGSWFVLGSVVTTAPLPASSRVVEDGCGSCRRCIAGCPTGAIIAPGVVDAGRCLAWLLQKPGTFARDYREALGDRIYGCDDCQEVCPPNRRVDRAAAPADPGPPGEPDAPPVEAWVPLLELLASNDQTLLARHGRWYLAGRDPRWLRRNALVALGNTASSTDPHVTAALRHHLRHPDPMLRAHAVWACRRLGRDDLFEGMSLDPAPEVRDELAAPAPAVRGRTVRIGAAGTTGR